jgi:riboflavin kinase/FMN adenylyltransferase
MKPCVVAAIGTFDGVHLGHQLIINKVVERARKLSLKSLVVTFDSHPRNILNDSLSHTLITDIKEKVSLIRSYGIDHVLVLKTDKELLKMSAYDFLKFIGKKFTIKELVSGSDFRFGRDAQHGAHTTQEISRDFGFKFHILHKKKIGAVVAASSHIRTLISQGKVDEARKILGRYYMLSGTVIRGRGIGHRLGFATANMSCEKNIFLHRGVYAACAIMGKKMFPAAVNVGVNPTVVSRGQLSVEAHLLDFNKNILGKKVKLYFLKYLRREKKFSSRDKLIAAIAADIISVRAAYFSFLRNSI